MAEVERDRSTLRAGKLRVPLSPRDEVSEQRLSEDTEAGPVTHGGYLEDAPPTNRAEVCPFFKAH